MLKKMMISNLFKKLINLMIIIPISLFIICLSLKTHASQVVSKQKTSVKTFKFKNKSKHHYSYKVKGKKYARLTDSSGFVQTGVASWYGPGFHGRKTANGETFNQNALTGAHRTLPLATLVEVTNLENHRSVIIKINDRGPYYGNRVLDLSRAAARKLGVLRKGTAKIQLIAL